MSGPTLTTERLTLTPHTPADLEKMVTLYGDPAIMAQLGASPATREEVWHRLLRFIAHWPVMGYGHWVVRASATGAYLGEVGLMESRRATEPSFEGTPEAAWAFTPAAQGRGYAREAVAAMLAWADGQGIGRTVAIIAPANTASIRVARAVGFGAAGEVTYKESALLLLARPRLGRGA